MTREEMANLIDLQIRLNFRTQTAAAEKIGVSINSLNNTLRKLKKGEGVSLETLEKIIKVFNYEIELKKKEER